MVSHYTSIIVFLNLYPETPVAGPKHIKQGLLSLHSPELLVFLTRVAEIPFTGVSQT